MGNELTEPILSFVKAITSYGGEDYFRYEDSYTQENRDAFERWLEKATKVSGVSLFRGYRFEERYWEDCMIDEGSIIGEDQLTQELDLPAFTTGPLRAVKYMSEFGEGMYVDNSVKVLFEVHTSGKYFVDISEYSRYREECEHRCIRNTKLLVERIRKRSGFTELVCVEQ